MPQADYKNTSEKSKELLLIVLYSQNLIIAL